MSGHSLDRPRHLPFRTALLTTSGQLVPSSDEEGSASYCQNCVGESSRQYEDELPYRNIDILKQPRNCLKSDPCGPYPSPRRFFDLSGAFSTPRSRVSYVRYQLQRTVALGRHHFTCHASSPASLTQLSGTRLRPARHTRVIIGPDPRRHPGTATNRVPFHLVVQEEIGRAHV